MLNGFDIMTNIEVVKVGLFLFNIGKLGIDELRAGIMTYKLVEMRLNKLGMRADADLIISALRSIDKFITEKKVSLWLSHNASKLRGKNQTIMPDEFLFII
jgi:hypothetical protein